VGLLAGCGGDSGGGTDTETTAADGQDGETPTATPTETPTETQTEARADVHFKSGRNGGDTPMNAPSHLEYNLYHPTNGLPFVVYDVMFTVLGEPSMKADITWKHGAKSWELGDGKLTVNLREDWQWSNGREVTAEDIHIGITIDRYFDSGVWDTFTTSEVIDEKTWELSYESNVNPRLIESAIFDGGFDVSTPRWIYGEFADRFVNAQPDYMPGDEANDEVQQVQSDLQDVSIHPKEDKAAASGPFVWSDANAQQAVMEINEGFWNSDAIEFKFFDALGGRSYQRLQQLVNSGRADYSWATNPDLTKQALSSDGHFVSFVPGKAQGPLFNFQHDLYGNHERGLKVRQALIYMADREQIRADTGGEVLGRALSIPSSYPFEDKQQVQELFPDLADTWKTYGGIKGNPEKGRKLLREAGFSEQNGSWVTPDGDKWTITLKGRPPGGIQGQVSKSLSSIWTNRGLDAVYESVDLTTLNSEIRKVNAQDEAPADRPYGVHISKPYNLPIKGFIPHFSMRSAYVGSSDFTSITKTGRFNRTLGDTIKAPPLGEPDGELRDFNWLEAVKELSTGSPEENFEYFRELAWVQNHAIPSMPLRVSRLGRIFNKERFNLPPEDSELWGYLTPGRGGLAENGWPKPK